MKKILLSILLLFLISCGERLAWGDYKLTIVYLSGDKSTIVLHNCTEPYQHYHYGAMSITWRQLNKDGTQLIEYHNTVPISHYYVEWINKKE